MNKKEIKEIMLLFSVLFSALQQVVDDRLKSLEKTPDEECGTEEMTVGESAPTYDTCFFIYKDGRTYGECMTQLQNMLNSSSKQSKVLRKLFGEEGRDWFDLFDRDVDEIAHLLGQFTCKCGTVSKYMIKKALTEIRPIIEQQRLSRLTKHKSS